MNKKNYNLEIFFESQKKSFVILSKNKITFDEVKQKTMREFRIPKEYEKDMRFIIKIRNRPITILNDVQILNNLEEISKNNYYLKINFNINNSNYNNNYIYQSSKNLINKYNQKMRPNTVNIFSIISNIKSNEKIQNEDIKKENKYKEEIKQLKEEIEKLKSEKSNKSEFDIRKFDEKYRDLSNKNNILEQKITELENENKTLKTGINKNTVFSDNLLFENTFENDSLAKEIEKIVIKLISEHNENIIKEISGLKNLVEIIQKEQKNFYDKFKAVEENSEFFKTIKKIQTIQNNDEKNINDKNEENMNLSNNEKISNKINFKKNKIINNLNSDDNFDDLDNRADIIMNDKEEDNKNNNIQNSNINNKNEGKEQNSNNSKDVKRDINF